VKVRRCGPVVLVVVLAWLGLAYRTGPVDAHGYRQTAVRTAQAALNAVRTGALAADAELLDPYARTLLDDQLGQLAGAQQRLLAEPPPDSGTRAARDQLLPLLTASATQLGDLAQAMATGDRDEIRAHQARLRRLGVQLDAFVERYR
jgi:hypothetical protein